MLDYKINNPQRASNYITWQVIIALGGRGHQKKTIENLHFIR